MTGRLAIDFGTSNTVIAIWDENEQIGIPLYIPDFSRSYQQGAETISVTPSLIHFTEHNQRFIGNQVLQQGLYHSSKTFRWMKRYISNRSPIKVSVNGKNITPAQASEDFLSTLLIFAGQEINLQNEEIALTVPVEAYEHYENWLSSTVEKAGFPRYRLIDEPSAAALGYASHIQPGSVYLIFDFGGGTMHAAVVLMESDNSKNTGRRCRVLGKAGKDIGGTSIDQWLFAEILKMNNYHDSDDDIRTISNALLVECERAKESLTTSEQYDITVLNPDSGTLISASLTRPLFEEILDKHELYTEINNTIRSALNTARERGYNESNIQAVLMVGGSSQIPSVQRLIRQLFGRDKVKLDRPLDAVARGAASFIAGVDFFDHIQHDYAIRYVNPQKGEYDYKIIVEHGTPYPSIEPIAKLTIKASYNNQEQLGLAIFEMGQQKNINTNSVELIFDPSGAARIMNVPLSEQEQRNLFWMNEHKPTFLNATPPAKKGEPRFEVMFFVDANKRLTITSRDLLTNELTHKDFPVVKLT